MISASRGRKHSRIWVALGALLFVQIADTTPAHALLIQADWQAVGDGLLTRDTATGFQWLDLLVTSRPVGRSFNDVSSQLGVGGEFQGFQYATTAEVLQLFTNAGIQDLSGNWSAANFGPIQSFVNLVGVTRGSFGAASIGITGDPGVSPNTQILSWAEINLMPNSSVFMQGRIGVSSVQADQAISFFGHWLVLKPIAVPEPSALFIFALGLAALGFLVRRRKSA